MPDLCGRHDLTSELHRHKIPENVIPLEDVVFQFTPTVIPKLSLLAVEDGGWQRA